ncbi:MAG: hypothetical protein ACEQSR_10005 [Candidatus Methylacidiphilales bacterium]
MVFSDILTEISKFSSFLPVIFGLIYFKKINKPFKGLVYFYAFCVFFEYFITEYKKIYGTNIPLLHLLTPIEFSMFFWVFWKYFNQHILFYLSVVSVFIAIAFLDAFYINTIYTQNIVARPTESIVLMIASFYYFYLNLTNHKKTTLIYSEAMFWFSTGILIYFTINFYMFLMISQLVPPTAYLSIDIHSIFNTIANLLFAKAFTCFKWKT